MGTFECGECFQKHTGVTQQYRYTTPTACRNSMCNNRKNWHLVLVWVFIWFVCTIILFLKGESVFADWQKVKVQESPDEILPGSLPRRMNIICRRSLTDSCHAGDRCVFTVFLYLCLLSSFFPSILSLTSRVSFLLCQMWERSNYPVKTSVP